MKTVTYKGRPQGLIRGLRKAGLMGLTFGKDAQQIQRILDKEAKRTEVIRILNIGRGGTA